MTSAIRAMIVEDFVFHDGGIGIRIGLANLDDQGRVVQVNQVLDLDPDNSRGAWFRWRVRSDAERMGALVENDTSIIHLPEGVGQALLSALARHFDGTASDMDLRSDLRHERDRRDRLEESMMTLTHALASTANVAAGLRWSHFSPPGLGGQGSSFSSSGPPG